MKNKRWLFILLGILFLINISFLVISRYSRYDLWIIDRLTGIMDEQLNADIRIGSLSISDKQLHLSDLEIIDRNGVFQVDVDHVYLDFNLFKVIFSNIKLFKAVEHISVIGPAVRIRLDKLSANESSSDGTEAFSLNSLPDISDYFQFLDAAEGTLSLEYGNDELLFRDVFHDFDLQIVNNRTTSLSLNLRRGKSIITGENNNREYKQSTPTLKIQFETEDNKLASFEYLLLNYHPDVLRVNQLDEIDFLLNLHGEYKDNSFRSNGFINDLKFIYHQKEILAEELEVFSFNDRWFLSSGNFLMDGNPALVDCELYDIFTNPGLQLTMQAEDIGVKKYLSFLEGNANVEVKLSGSPLRPSGSLKARSRELYLGEEKISDVLLSADYAGNHVELLLEKATWQDNLITGEGNYSFDNSDFIFDLEEDALNFWMNGFAVKADLKTNISYNGELTLKTSLHNFSIENGNLFLAGLNLDTAISGRELEARLNSKNLDITLSGSLQENNYKSVLDLKGLNLNEILAYRTPLLKSYPYLSGQVEISYENDVLEAVSGLRMYNIHYGELAGNLQTHLLIDFPENFSSFSFETEDATYRLEPFSITMQGTGTRERFSSEMLNLNDELRAQLSINTKPNLNFALNLNGEQLSLNKYLHYFFTPYTVRQFNGEIDLNIDLEYPDNFSGSLRAANLSYKKLGPFDNELHFSLKDDKFEQDLSLKDKTVEFTNRLATVQDQPVISLTGKTVLGEDLETEVQALTENLSLKLLAPEIDLQGFINSEWSFVRKNRANEIRLLMDATSLQYRELFIDSLFVNALQTDDVLYIDTLYAANQELFETNLKGNLGYNIITNRLIEIDDLIELNFQGDLLKTLSNTFTFLEDGNSDSNLKLKIGIHQDELSVISGNFMIKDGFLVVHNQPQRAENIDIDLLFYEDRLTINKFESKIGEGRLFLRNEIRDDDLDFHLGMLNLGHFYAHTSQEGISIHLPKYLPHNSVGRVVLRGRNSPEAEIAGPFDDIKMVGDLHISNASVTYPPETENLFKLINLATERRGSDTPEPLPFELDLKLIANNQVRYVTYPTNLLLMPNSYLQLIYKDNVWIASDAFFASESGSLDMFGTTFTLDYADFYITHELDDYRLNGVFFRYAADGSLITLDVTSENNGNSSDFLENINFQLKSDNPEDRTTLHVLSKIRYNRRLEDIPRSQQNALMQDEFLQLAGMGLTGAIVDPLIYPFINRTRNLLRLDFFSIKPNLVENIVRTYGFHEQNRNPEEDSEIFQFGKNILLNNLSVTMGKFVARDLYLDYELLMQKPVDVIGRRDLLVYHNFTFHYSLPYRLRFAYRFYLKPEVEINSHEVFMRRSFNFW